MTKIHHAVAKKATSNGIALTDLGDGNFRAVDADNSKTLEGTDPTALLAEILAARPKAAKAPRKVHAANAVRSLHAKKPAKRKARKTDEDEDGEDKGKEPKSVVKAKYKKLYKPTKDRNGQKFADELHDFLFPEDGDEEFSVKNFHAVCRDNNIDPKRWTHLKNKDGSPNYGMWRMNAGNVLRGLIRKGTDVKVGTKTYKAGSLEQKRWK